MSTIELTDAERRMPTLQLIEDDAIREETARLTAEAPDYFWTVPASTSGYHHPICQEDRGLWVHTLMLATAIDEFADTYVEQGRIDEHERDYAHAAAILHDQRKCGDPVDPVEGSTMDHELLMAEVVRESDLPAEIADAVESHMGAWYDGPAPETGLDDLVHMADMTASSANITPAVHGPLPEVLQGKGVEVVDLG